jgi:heterodisulfide reductase subunit C2
MTNCVAIEDLDPEGRLRITACLQCVRCSSGCTMRAETDLLPHQINRMAALGLTEELLASRAIWLCASCQTCVSRCPMQVDTPALVDKLREMSKVTDDAEVARVHAFNKAMLGSMRRFGRVYELGLMTEYKLRTRDFFRDVAKFPKVVLKGKISLKPPMVSGRKAVGSIFRRVRRSR